jgi:hypothetical protein
MARPRVIKIGGGEVVLKNLEPAEADRIKALILGETPDKDTKEVSEPEETFSYMAASIFEDDKGWHTATVGYNPVTGEARVTEVSSGERLKSRAIEKFKILAGKHILR